MINFLKKHQLSEAQIGEFLLKSETFDAKKRTILLKEGDICQHIYFVQSGILRAGIHDETNKDWTHCFYSPEGLVWAGLATNCMGKKPSEYFIEVLEDAKITAFPVEYIRQLRRKDMFWSRFIMCQIINNLDYLERKNVNQLKFSPEKRYLTFMDMYPKIVQSIPQHYIASYIGVVPESLSRIRKRLNEFSNN